MVTTPTQLANLSLDILSTDVISDIDEDSNPARACKRNIQQSVDEVLQDYPYNCALARISIGKDADAPQSEWLYQYSMPNNPYCLQVRKLVGVGDDQWVAEGRKILTDASSPINIVFVQRITNYSLLSSMVAELCALKLASKICFRLTNSREFKRELDQEYQVKLIEARAIDAQEGANQQIDVDDWWSARI